MIEYYLYIIVFILALLSSAFLSGSEVALLSTPRSKIKILMNENVPRAALLAGLKKKPEQFLIPILIGKIIANVLAATVATVLMIAFFKEIWVAVLVSTVLVAVLLFGIGEIGPMVYAGIHTTSLALTASPVIHSLSRLFSPAVRVSNRLAATITGKSSLIHHMITEEEIKEWIDVGQEEGTIEKGEQEMLHSVLEFGDTRVREAMTPRVDVVMIEDSSSLEKAIDIFKSTGFSRLPVYHGNTDTIVGILNIKDVFAAVMDHQHVPIVNLCSEPYFVPESKKIDDLFREVKIRKIHMTVVLDEYGSIIGIITLEDILEELVGDIFDEFDTEEHDLLKMSEGMYSVDARMWVEDLNKELGLFLPESDRYETIAGLLFDKLGYIPRIGEVCDLQDEGVRLIVIHMKGKRITRIKLLILQDRSGQEKPD